MKLIFAIVSKDDSSAVTKALIKQHHFVTKLASSGGFLRNGNVTLMIGCNVDELDDVIDIFTEHSRTRKEIIPNSVAREFGFYTGLPTEVTVGGATLFILDVEKQIKI